MYLEVTVKVNLHLEINSIVFRFIGNMGFFRGRHYSILTRLTRLDLGRLQRPNRNSFFPNLPIQHEFVYLLAVVKPRVPPKDVNICELRSSPSTMSLKGFPEEKLMTQKFFMSG